MRWPGLIDLHVHLRQPGGEHKEDLSSGTAAALAGGFTLVLEMPNTEPPTTSAERLAAKGARVQGHARCTVGLFAGATEANAGDPVEGAWALKVYLDRTFGPLRLESLPALVAHFRAWPRSRPLALHAEGWMAAAAVGLAAAFDRPIHLCHVSRREEVLLIRAAKERGLPVTAEVTPHHLAFSQADARAVGPRLEMRPRLGSDRDRQALWEHLEVFDAVATDHAPHTLEEKAGPDPPPGVPGLETALPVLLTWAAEGRLGYERVLELLYQGPRRAFGLPQQPETWIEIDASARWTLSDEGLQTRCGWTPFDGFPARGRLRQVVYRGRPAYLDGRLLASPGTGEWLRPPDPLRPTNPQGGHHGAQR